LRPQAYQRLHQVFDPDHPNHIVSADFKCLLEDHIRSLAKQTAATQPDALALRLNLLLERQSSKPISAQFETGADSSRNGRDIGCNSAGLNLARAIENTALLALRQLG